MAAQDSVQAARLSEAVKVAMLNEAERIINDCEAATDHLFTTADKWGIAKNLLGLPLVVAAAVSGITALSEWPNGKENGGGLHCNQPIPESRSSRRAPADCGYQLSRPTQPGPSVQQD